MKEELLSPTLSSSTIELELFTKESGIIANLMDMERITTRMEATMRVLLTTDFHMALVDSSTAMEITTMVKLNSAEETEKEATVQAISLSKVSLRTMFSMVRAKK